MSSKVRSLVETVIDTIDIPMHVVDPEHRILLFNQAFHGWCEELNLELPGTEVVGQDLFDVFPFLTTAPGEYQQVFATGVPLVTQSTIRIEDREICTETTKTPILSEGQVRYVITTVRDVTERKRTNDALQEAYAEMERKVEERTAELRHEVAERERLQEEIIEAQRQALRELSTPIIPIMDRIIVMPLVGSIDSMRARDITRSLLAGIREHRGRVVILDITGVPIVDSGVADHLNRTVQAARLKGARTIITGISDAVAETIVDLGIDWSGIETLSDLQSGLFAALQSLGVIVTRERVD
jgi:PAS domain S-box-containing protein